MLILCAMSIRWLFYVLLFIRFSLSIGSPSKPHVSSGNPVIVEGNTATLNCSSKQITEPDNGTSSLTYTWFVNGDSQLPCNFKASGPMLRIQVVTVDDMLKNISCRTNQSLLQSELSEVFKLNIYYGPKAAKITPSSQSLIIKEGENTGLISCSANCNPKCGLRWKFKETGINSKFKDFYTTGGKLALKNVTRHMAGTYQCVSRNKYGSKFDELSLNVQYGPNVVYTYPSKALVKVQEGQRLKPILCTAECNPGCEFKWSYFHSKNETNPLYSIPYNHLHMIYVTRNMSGTYRCDAKNLIKSSFTEFTLNVLYGPNDVHITPTKRKYVMEEGENFDQISCSAQCNPVCVIQWKFNGDGTDSKFEDFGNQRNRLLLQYVTRDMAGTYRCVAHNKYGSKKKDVSLNVQYGPNVVSTSPTNQSMIAQEGQSFGPILCTAKCNPGCEYKWRFIPMGDKIAPPFSTPNNHLHIIYVTRNMAGTYRCEAKNKIKQKYTDINLNVFYGPNAVDVRPKKQMFVMKEGESFDKISCSAQCNPECVIQWKFNSNGTNSTFEDFGNQGNRLLLDNVTRDMAGTYRCVAQNKYGSTKKDVSLNVQYGPNVVSTSPTNQSMIAQEGQSFGPILCTAECNPGCEYKWRFIPMGDKIAPPFSTPNNHLHIIYVTRNMAGTYRCEAKNKIKHKYTDINLNVFYGPNAVDVRPKKQMFVMKEGASFDQISCSAQCNPECVIQWKFNSNGTNATFEDFGSQGNILLLDNVTRDMAGTYRCVAQNKYGSKKKDVSLNVQYGPNLVSLSPTYQSVSVQEGQSFGPIICEAECNPHCEFNWTLKNTVDDASLYFNIPNNYLHIVYVTRNMAGIYRCVAKNQISFNDVQISLNILWPPEKQNYESLAIGVGLSSVLLCVIIAIIIVVLVIRHRKRQKKIATDQANSYYKTPTRGFLTSLRYSTRKSKTEGINTSEQTINNVERTIFYAEETTENAEETTENAEETTENAEETTENAEETNENAEDTIPSDRANHNISSFF